MVHVITKIDKGGNDGGNLFNLCFSFDLGHIVEGIEIGDAHIGNFFLGQLKNAADRRNTDVVDSGNRNGRKGVAVSEREKERSGILAIREKAFEALGILAKEAEIHEGNDNVNDLGEIVDQNVGLTFRQRGEEVGENGSGALIHVGRERDAHKALIEDRAGAVDQKLGNNTAQEGGILHAADEILQNGNLFLGKLVKGYLAQLERLHNGRNRFIYLAENAVCFTRVVGGVREAVEDLRAKKTDAGKLKDGISGVGLDGVTEIHAKLFNACEKLGFFSVLVNGGNLVSRRDDMIHHRNKTEDRNEQNKGAEQALKRTDAGCDQAVILLAQEEDVEEHLDKAKKELNKEEENNEQNLCDQSLRQHQDKVAQGRRGFEQLCHRRIGGKQRLQERIKGCVVRKAEVSRIHADIDERLRNHHRIEGRCQEKRDDR